MPVTTLLALLAEPRASGWLAALGRHRALVLFAGAGVGLGGAVEALVGPPVCRGLVLLLGLVLG
eukprot:5709688-Pyramimonas_sp.AAC.1